MWFLFTISKFIFFKLATDLGEIKCQIESLGEIKYQHLHNTCTMGLLVFITRFKTLAFGLKLMLNPCQMPRKCACLLSVCYNLDAYFCAIGFLTE